jgi:hypothetical protein
MDNAVWLGIDDGRVFLEGGGDGLRIVVSRDVYQKDVLKVRDRYLGLSPLGATGESGPHLGGLSDGSPASRFRPQVGEERAGALHSMLCQCCP